MLLTGHLKFKLISHLYESKFTNHPTSYAVKWQAQTIYVYTIHVNKNTATPNL